MIQSQHVLKNLFYILNIMLLIEHYPFFDYTVFFHSPNISVGTVGPYRLLTNGYLGDYLTSCRSNKAISCHLQFYI